jgi:hypothetical protein
MGMSIIHPRPPEDRHKDIDKLEQLLFDAAYLVTWLDDHAAGATAQEIADFSKEISDSVGLIQPNMTASLDMSVVQAKTIAKAIKDAKAIEEPSP